MIHKVGRIGLFLALLAAIAMAVAFRDQLDAAALEEWVKQAGTAGPIIFMLIYAIGTILFLPGSVLTLAGGALFGPVLGTFLNLTGATLGALCAFAIARYIAHDWVIKKTAGRVRALVQGVEAEGWRFVAFVRLVPLFPFNLLNYALGLTRIPMFQYLIATYIFMLPGAIAYTYLGYAGREAVGGGEGLVQKGMLALALLALVTFLPRFISRLRQRPMLSASEVKSRLDAGDDILLLDVRTVADFTGKLGHISQAVNLPLEELAARLAELDGDRDKLIALVCTTDRRSARAEQMLTRHGFADVHVVKGGMTDWNRRGYPVE